MGERHCVDFLAWPIISTSSLATSVRRQCDYTNCCGMAYTGVGSQHSNKLLTPSRQTSPNLRSWGTLTPQSLSHCLLILQRVVLVLHVYRMVTLWPMPHEPQRRPKLNMRKSRRSCFLPHFHAESSIYGQQATIETDHKPLTAIVYKPLHLVPAHLQHMLLQLQKYDLKFI